MLMGVQCADGSRCGGGSNVESSTWNELKDQFVTVNVEIKRIRVVQT